MRPLYSDIYLFQVGGRWGCHAAFDFWPERKEVFVADEPGAILQVVNGIGITHLALPEGEVRPSAFRYKEREAAVDRLKQCYLYEPGGQVADADVVLRSNAPAILEIYHDTLDPAATATRLAGMLADDTGRPAERRRATTSASGSPCSNSGWGRSTPRIRALSPHRRGSRRRRAKAVSRSGCDV